ncbi:MAG: cupin-like domain-containing protein [Pirellulaceae bacterium]|nr:cupin-like domain-containing protein [Pirellulaceae bacterium]
MHDEVLRGWGFSGLQDRFGDRPISCHNKFDGSTFMPSWSTLGDLCSRLNALGDSALPALDDPDRMKLYGVVNSKRVTPFRPILREVSRHFSHAISFVWVGLSPGGMHVDYFNNVLVQISGRKRVTVFSPSDADAISRNHYLKLPNKVDVLAPENIEVCPALGKASGYQVELGPGDALVIPSAAYHAPEALTADSVSVNSFFSPNCFNRYLSRHSRKSDSLPWWMTNAIIRASGESFRFFGRPLIRLGHYEIM